MWDRDVPVFRAPFCPSTLALSLSLSSLPSSGTLLFLHLGSRAHSLPSTSLPGCDVPSVVPPLRYVTLCLCCAFFHPPKEASCFFSRDHRRRPHRKIYLRFVASQPCTTFTWIGPVKWASRCYARLWIKALDPYLSTYEDSTLKEFYCMRKSMIIIALSIILSLFKAQLRHC